MAVNGEEAGIVDNKPPAPAPAVQQQQRERKRSYRQREREENEQEPDEPEPISAVLEEARELQKLRRRTAGITAEKLMETIVEPVAEQAPASQDPFKLQLGGLVDVEETKKKTDLSLNGFTQQTNTLDVDRHMVAYVEQEMKKRKGLDKPQATTQAADPMAELYMLSENIKKAKAEEPREDNITLSASMLVAIPEIDLGIESKLKNIEETERAKKTLHEKKQEPNQNIRQPYSEHEKRFAKTGTNENNPKNKDKFATDELVLERFKKRQQMYRRRR